MSLNPLLLVWEDNNKGLNVFGLNPNSLNGKKKKEKLMGTQLI